MRLLIEDDVGNHYLSWMSGLNKRTIKAYDKVGFSVQEVSYMETPKECIDEVIRV
mgnify:CR=1 FL=1